MNANNIKEFIFVGACLVLTTALTWIVWVLLFGLASLFVPTTLLSPVVIAIIATLLTFVFLTWALILITLLDK